MHKFMYQSIDYSITPNANIIIPEEREDFFFLGRNAEAFVLKTNYVWSKTLPYSEVATLHNKYILKTLIYYKNILRFILI